MLEEEIIAFVQKEAEPLPSSAFWGKSYRVAATLTDGTYLPCVVVADADFTVKLAMKRFDEIRRAQDPHWRYPDIVESFVTKGNTVNDYDLRELSLSPFAIPGARMLEIGGETSMGWTEFYATMRDGQEFRFGTTFDTVFFNMPKGYTCSDIVRIVPAVRGEEPRTEMIYREKPFFTCYVHGL